MLNTPPHEKRAGPEVSFRSFMVPLPPLRDGGRALPIPSFRQTCLPLILDAPDCICSPGRLLLGGGRTYASYTMRKPSGRFPSGGRLVICFMDGRSGTLGLGGIRAAAVALAEHVAQAGVAHFGDHVRDEVRGHRPTGSTRSSWSWPHASGTPWPDTGLPASACPHSSAGAMFYQIQWPS